MHSKDLEIFNEMPFFFWVKDKKGRYLWGNRAMCEFVGKDIAGKPDSDLMWADNADAIRANDNQVLKTGMPVFCQEYVDKTTRGNAMLNVCKFAGEFEGKKCTFGISFIIE